VEKTNTALLKLNFEDQLLNYLKLKAK